eukprot:3240245-Amphidinium_carterae.1
MEQVCTFLGASCTGASDLQVSTVETQARHALQHHLATPYCQRKPFQLRTAEQTRLFNYCLSFVELRTMFATLCILEKSDACHQGIQEGLKQLQENHG